MNILEEIESNTLTLRKVRPSDLDSIREYREEFLTNGDSMDALT